MPTFLPVPWFRWQRFRVVGVVRELGSGRPLPGLNVCAFDRDVVQDDCLGRCATDETGRFEIHFTDAHFKDWLESRPDIYLCIFAPGSEEPVHDTSCQIRENASHEEYFEIEIPSGRLPAGARA